VPTTVNGAHSTPLHVWARCRAPAVFLPQACDFLTRA
jgi:hypothetical protein